MLISDRDGVLFDTCQANLESYCRAAELMGLATNTRELEAAIHSGEGISNFYRTVWGELSTAEFGLLRSTKSEYFIEEIASVRVNHDFIENFLEGEREPYLVTRASIASTRFLVNHFGLDFFGKRVISTSETASKIDIFSFICSSNNLDRSQVKVVDDSPHIVHASAEAGFQAIQYPHFCSS